MVNQPCNIGNLRWIWSPSSINAQIEDVHYFTWCESSRKADLIVAINAEAILWLLNPSFKYLYHF